MKRLHKIVLAGAMLSLAAGPITAALVRAQDETPHARKRPFAHGERMHGRFASAPLISIALRHQSELNLNSEQVANLEKIKEHYQSQVAPIHQQLMANEKEIAALMQQTPAHLIEIKSKIHKGEQYRSELRYLRIEALENGKSVLTAVQQEQLKTLMHTRHGRFGGPKGQTS